MTDCGKRRRRRVPDKALKDKERLEKHANEKLCQVLDAAVGHKLNILCRPYAVTQVVLQINVHQHWLQTLYMETPGLVIRVHFSLVTSMRHLLSLQ